MSEDEAERDSAPPGEVVVAAEDHDEGDQDWSPFDEIQDDFKPRPIPKVTAADGLPTQFAPATETDIPELSPDTLVCMGDYSEFVLRDEWGQVFARWTADKVERTPSGRYRALWSDVSEYTKHPDGPKATDFAEHAHVCVEPVRPPCKHYARQLTQFDLNAQAMVMLRVCAARRTTEGAFMSLRDRAMWACELREPREVTSFARLEEFDQRKMREGQDREYVPMFGGAEADTNGIFGGSNGGQ